MSMRDWLPFLHRKDNPVAKMIVLGLAGGHAALPPKRNFGVQALEGYQQNVTVYACINIISRAAAGVPWVLMQRPKTGGGPPKKLMSFQTAAKAWSMTGKSRNFARKAVTSSEIENHPLLTLIEKPNPLQGGPEYTETVFGFLLISGNSFETWIGPETGPNRGRPLEMWALRPDRTKVLPGEPDSGELVGGYRYTVGASKPQDFDPAIVLHQRFFSPLDDFYGLSPIQVASRVVDGDNAALEWNHNLIANDARPPAALIIKGALQTDTRDQLRLDLEKRYSGTKNARRPIILEGDVDWKTLAVSPADLDWLEGRKLNAREIGKCYGVPSEFVDMDSISYASKEQARKGLYQETILPALDRRRDNLNNSITPSFGDGLYLDYDRDQIEALHEDAQKLYQGLRQADWLSINEKRAATGYDQYDKDESIDPADIPVALLKPSALPGSPQDTTPPGDPTDKPPVEGGVADGADDGQKDQDFSDAQRALETKLEKKLDAHFRKQARALAAHLKQTLAP